MRAASFTIQDEHGHNGEVSVLPMPRLNIADVEIVNLWRQQVGLGSASEEEVSQLAEKTPIGELEGKLFDLVSPQAEEDPDHAPRIITAYLHDEQWTWFFKLTGPSHIVETERPAFRQFLASIDLVRLQRDFQKRAAQATPPPARASVPLPQWEVPKDWRTSEPNSSMLLASFSIGSEVDGPAEVTVSSLGGGGGGLLANINRWRRQLSLPALAADELGDATRSLALDGLAARFVDIKGAEQRIAAAIVTVGAQTWFYKMMGSPQTVGKQIDAFTAFVQSVRYSGNG